MKKRYWYTLIALGAVFIVRLLGDAPPQVPEVSARAQQLAGTSILIDGHNDLPYWVSNFDFDIGSVGGENKDIDAEWLWVFGDVFGHPEGDRLHTHTDLDRLEAGNLNAQFFSIFVDPKAHPDANSAQAEAFRIIENMDAQFAAYPARIASTCSSADIRAAFSAGRVAGLYGLEGAHALDQLPDAGRYLDAGVRYITMTWSNSNRWATSSGDSDGASGLSEDGRALVHFLNTLGMLIDVSHASDATFWDVIRETNASIMASHSSARILVDVDRNLSDDMLRAIADNGGIAMINFGGIAIDRRKASIAALVWDLARHWGFSRPSIEMIVEHIAHAVAIAGIDHVGLGSDFDGTLFLPAGLEDVSGYPRLVQALIDVEFSDEEIRKILGENLLRVMGDVQGRATEPVPDCYQ